MCCSAYALWTLNIKNVNNANTNPKILFFVIFAPKTKQLTSSYTVQSTISTLLKSIIQNIAQLAKLLSFVTNIPVLVLKKAIYLKKMFLYM